MRKTEHVALWKAIKYLVSDADTFDLGMEILYKLGYKKCGNITSIPNLKFQPLSFPYQTNGGFKCSFIDKFNNKVVFNSKDITDVEMFYEWFKEVAS